MLSPLTLNNVVRLWRFNDRDPKRKNADAYHKRRWGLLDEIYKLSVCVPGLLITLSEYVEEWINQSLEHAYYSKEIKPYWWQWKNFLIIA